MTPFINDLALITTSYAGEGKKLLDLSFLRSKENDNRIVEIKVTIVLRCPFSGGRASRAVEEVVQCVLRCLLAICPYRASTGSHFTGGPDSSFP